MLMLMLMLVLVPVLVLMLMLMLMLVLVLVPVLMLMPEAVAVSVSVPVIVPALAVAAPAPAALVPAVAIAPALVAATVRAVHVAVLDFRVGRLSDVDDVHHEFKGHARERVVSVHHHGVFPDFPDHDGLPAQIGVGEEAVAHAEFHALEEIAPDFLDQLGMPDAVSSFGGHQHVDAVAFLLAEQGVLQPGHDVRMADEHLHRVLAVGGVENLAVFVGDDVVD